MSAKSLESAEDSPYDPLPAKRKAYKGVAMEGLIAMWYSNTQKKSIEQYRLWARIAVEHISEGANILEVAPGPGYLSIELAKLGRYKITGLDISNTFVKIATEKAKAEHLEQQAEFRHGDAAHMPFANETFDFVICTSAFKNFPEPVKVLDEIFRVLKKPSGIALIVDMRKEVSKEELDKYVDGMKLGWVNSYMTKQIFKHMLLKSAYTEGEILDFVRRSRFSECEIVDEAVGREIWLKKQEASLLASGSRRVRC